MKRPTEKDFERFKAEFRKWQERFGLNHYRVTFIHGKLKGDNYAEINVDTLNSTALVRLSDDCDEEDYDTWFGPEETARHECIHLVLDEIEDLAYSRFLRQEEINAAIERTVRRIQHVIREK